MQLHAVTWNSGVGAMNTGSAGTALGAALPSPPAASRARASAVLDTNPMNSRFIKLWTEPRCVSWAPFGKPVVPDV